MRAPWSGRRSISARPPAHRRRHRARGRAACPRSTRRRRPSACDVVRAEGLDAVGQGDRHVGGDALVPDPAARRASATRPSRRAAPTRRTGRTRRGPSRSRTSSRRRSGARPASWSAPDTISAELAVSPSTSDDQRQVGRDAVRARPGCSVALVGGVALDVDDAAREELAGDADGLVDVAARVAAQVEDEPVGAGGPRRPSSASTMSSAAPFENWSRRMSAVFVPGTIVQ